MLESALWFGRKRGSDGGRARPGLRGDRAADGARRRGRGRGDAGAAARRRVRLPPGGAVPARVRRLLLPAAPGRLLCGPRLRLLRARPAQVRAVAAAAPDPELRREPVGLLPRDRRGRPDRPGRGRARHAAAERPFDRRPGRRALGRPGEGQGPGGRPVPEQPVPGHRRAAGDAQGGRRPRAGAALPVPQGEAAGRPVGPVPAQHPPRPRGRVGLRPGVEADRRVPGAGGVAGRRCAGGSSGCTGASASTSRCWS